ncbi:MAG: ribose-5-phosphate isomerase RpiA [Tepidimonas ignava]|uniref:Ribose-5-phosphate isomerase A n=2 Tax=Tepidimonas TaxID=114248 RepID=A0A4R3LCI8_9BURK|nr:ribose-5-phosphate isomerase RpiA [Tepidimonas ignava]MCX7815157.1 ribose-5-phosphate isomerase RpiA [Tepidimonas ignava]TCS97673.1 ribose-5-phosphate isomerase [Tepidimonas ignava]TSE24052.1 Ribose-5-phosphate isomerase A [Tepidimonas ignava]
MPAAEPMTQDQLKALVGRAALDYVGHGHIIGVGTGSTVNCFIDALAEQRERIVGAVSSSEATTQRLRAHGIRVFDANEVEELAVYIDGADEIDPRGYMIKGGGAALTREKIVAAQARRFVCIADQSKWVPVLGRFPLPVEVIPMAAQRIIRQFAALGGTARLRLRDGAPLVTDNGQHILDVTGLQITDPPAFESMVNDWPGVVTVGVFAHQRAHVCLLGTPEGVRTVTFDGAAG